MIDFFLHRPIFASVCSVPHVAPPVVTVATNFIGANAQAMESYLYAQVGYLMHVALASKNAIVIVAQAGNGFSSGAHVGAEGSVHRTHL